jgi:hypothetical protein
MMFTYSAEYVVLNYSENLDSEMKYAVMSDFAVLSFDKFLEKNHDVALKSIREYLAGGTGSYSYDLGKGISFGIINSMINYYRVTGSTSLDEWYDSAPAVNAPPRMGKDRIMDQYEIYLNMNGYELQDNVPVKIKLGLIAQFVENVKNFFGNIGDAIGKFFSLLFFNIKNSYGENLIPFPVMFLLNIFFIPFWVVIGIEILPIIVAIVHAIGALLDSVTPFT